MSALHLTPAETIREATRDDLSALIALHEALYIQHQDAIIPDGVGELLAYRDFETVLRRDIGGLVADPAAIVLVLPASPALEDDGSPGALAGYITGHIVEEPQRVLRRRGVVEDWYVTAEARGRGFGRSLMVALEAEFKRRNCHVVESATWTFNEGAVAAHRRLGFEPFQVRFRKRIS